jgi:protein disulfide-isomerase
MKKIVSIILGTLICTPLSGVDSTSLDAPIAHHAPLLPWTDDLNQALTTAKAESLPVYLYFTGSSWCIWCKKMDREIHNADEFRQKTVGKCLFVRIELPAGGQPSEEIKQLLEKYHVSSVPTAILLSPDGEEITRFRYQQIAPADYADLLLKAAKREATPKDS